MHASRAAFRGGPGLGRKKRPFKLRAVFAQLLLRLWVRVMGEGEVRVPEGK